MSRHGKALAVGIFTGDRLPDAEVDLPNRITGILDVMRVDGSFQFSITMAVRRIQSYH